MKFGRVAILAMLGAAGCQTAPEAVSFPAGVEKPARCLVATADVQTECSRTSTRQISSCVVLRETPSGCGFGDESLKIAEKFRPSLGEDADPSMGKIRLTVRYRVNATGHIDPAPPSS